MKLSCVRKRSKMFQVKVISNDIRKTIVPSFMFLCFNLSKSVILCVNGNAKKLHQTLDWVLNTVLGDTVKKRIHLKDIFQVM